MRCGRFHDWLREITAYPTPRKIADYLRGELETLDAAETERQDVGPESPHRRHLARCGRCRARARRVLKYWSLLALFCRDVTPGPGLERRIGDRIRAEAEASARSMPDPEAEPAPAPLRPRAALRAAVAAASPEERTLYADASGPAPAVGWLVAVAGPASGCDVSLAPGENLVGRDPGCDIVLDDPSVAPRHASIVCAASPSGVAFFVLDHGSERGTFLNDGAARVTWARLEDQDVLRLGDVALKLKVLAGVSAKM